MGSLADCVEKADGLFVAAPAARAARRVSNLGPHRMMESSFSLHEQAYSACGAYRRTATGLRPPHPMALNRTACEELLLIAETDMDAAGIACRPNGDVDGRPCHARRSRSDIPRWHLVLLSIRRSAVALAYANAEPKTLSTQ